LQTILARLATIPDALITSAADANAGGDRYAERHAKLAANAGVRFERLRPPEGLDFNDILKQRRGP
jgi:Toprim-like